MFKNKITSPFLSDIYSIMFLFVCLFIFSATSCEEKAKKEKEKKIEEFNISFDLICFDNSLKIIFLFDNCHPKK